MSADFWCEEDEPVKRATFWMKYAHRHEYAIGESCCACTCTCGPRQMADPTNFQRNDDADDDDVEKEDTKMAAAEEDERIRVLRFVAAISLDRPCPICKYETFDRPHRDLRQCRACGELWGLDDSQTTDEFVREFGRMNPCQGCGTSDLDDFQIADKHGRQELVCRRCKTVQDTGPSPVTHLDEDFDLLDSEDHHRSCKADKLDVSEDIGKEEVNLTCPNCPHITEDFFEKSFERDSLVLAVCPVCSHIVFGIGKETEATCDKLRTEAGKNAPKCGGGSAPTARRTKQRCSEKPKPDSKDEDDLTVKQLMSRMGQEVGMAIGTEMGSIVQKHMKRGRASGSAGAAMRKAICEQIHKSAEKMGIV